MKKISLTLWAVATALTFATTSCSKDDDEPEEVILTCDILAKNLTGDNKIQTGITDGNAESAEGIFGVNLKGFNAVSKSALLDSEIAARSMVLYNYFTATDGGFYGGFAYAKFGEDEYLAPASEKPHSGESYIIANPGTVCKTIMRKGVFSYLQKDKINHVYIQNMSLVAYAAEEGEADYELEKFVAGDYLKVVATGYKLKISDGLNFKTLWAGIKDLKNSTGSSEFVLADYRTSTLKVVKDWTKWDLTDLGDADIIIFEIEGKVGSSSSTSTENPLNDYWKYFVLDDITLLTD